MLVDSHCHLNMLNLEGYDDDIANIVAAAQKRGVEYILNVATELNTFTNVLATAKRFDNVFASIGVHPDEILETEPSDEELLQLGSDKKIIAIGETGLDYYRLQGDLSWQHERFRQHIRVAKQLKKPLIIHTRMARADTIKILQEEKADEIGGVLHCFTEDWQMAKEALDLNFYVSFSGIITFKNADELREVVKQVPIERMLIETDAPFLTPAPFRGKPNMPEFVFFVAEKIAEIKNISFEEVAEKTSKNFFNLFFKSEKGANHG